MQRSRFLALLVLTPLAALVAPAVGMVSPALASTRGYSSSGTHLLRAGRRIASMRTPTIAARSALLCNRAATAIAAHRSPAGSGRYAVHGRTIRHSGTPIGRGTTRRSAAATVRLLNIGEAASWARVPGAPTGVTGVRAANGTITVRFTPPRDAGGSPITGYTVTATRTHR